MTSDTAQPDEDVAGEAVVDETLDDGRTLSDFEPPKRGYMDRMLSPQRGMDERVWNGRAFFVCPRCQRETFNVAEAKAHRC